MPAERRALRAEAVATGAWLGLVQVALGFALLSGGGASSLLYLGLLAAWLAGGARGALSGPGGPGRTPPRPGPPGPLPAASAPLPAASAPLPAASAPMPAASAPMPAASAPLLALALAALAAARAALFRWPFSVGAALAGMAAGALAGAYAGRFLRDRAARWVDARALLLHENNGFIGGFLAGGALLFGSARALDAVAGLLGAALLARSLRAPPPPQGAAAVAGRRRSRG